MSAVSNTATTPTTPTTAKTSSTGSTTGTTTSNASATTTTAQTFLKLLVAQMQNQDPMNPMDNAQVTTQMAQISTVTGIDSLNSSVKSLSGQFTQMQALQGASLVGKDVIVPGNQLSVTGKVAQGGFSLDTPADKVNVSILDKSGKVVDTLDLGKQPAGQGSFDWDASKVASTDGYTFKVTASAAGTDLKPTALMRDTVDAINTSGDTLTLELEKSGSVPYTSVQALN